MLIVSEVMEKFPDLREPMISRLLETFSEIKSGRVLRGVLWIVGEFALSEKCIQSNFKISD